MSLAGADAPVVLFLCGDVMTGRGIDQILPHSGNPLLYESYVHSAAEYVELAERVNGPIPRRADPAYIWGDALAELERAAPSARIINLETSVTASDDAWPKGINYRMHPANVACLVSAKIDCCVLANNHVLDWGRAGLTETLRTLHHAGMATVGAGADFTEAAAPAIIPLSGASRLLVFAAGMTSSGIPEQWQARTDRSGIHLLDALDDDAVEHIAAQVRRVKSARDVAVFSVHWGGNWGFDVPDEQRRFAHGLIDHAAVDVVHGHSSHHVKGIEVYHGRPILYGAGDLINDYEGIGGYERFHGDLSLLYFVALDPFDHRLVEWRLVPMQMRRFRLRHPDPEDARWLCDTLNREGQALGTHVTLSDSGALSVA